MRRFALMLCVAALLAPAWASASEATDGDNCVVSSGGAKQESIQEILTRLQNEIKKGTAVHTASEIQALEARLQEYNELLIALNSNP